MTGNNFSEIVRMKTWMCYQERRMTALLCSGQDELWSSGAASVRKQSIDGVERMLFIHCNRAWTASLYLPFSHQTLLPHWQPQLDCLRPRRPGCGFLSQSPVRGEDKTITVDPLWTIQKRLSLPVSHTCQIFRWEEFWMVVEVCCEIFPSVCVTYINIKFSKPNVWCQRRVQPGLSVWQRETQASIALSCSAPCKQKNMC